MIDIALLIMRFNPISLLDFIYPRSCIHCEASLRSDSPLFICPDCFRRLPYIEEPICYQCGYPFDGLTEQPHLCPNCTQFNYAFTASRSVFRHTELGRSLINTLKYKRGAYLEADISLILSQVNWLAEWVADSILVPIPLNPKRLKKRGYNQSLVICHAIHRQHPSTSILELLIRPKATPTQTKLNRFERRKNLKGAFELVDSAKADKKRSILLVDDVFTTGSTLHHAAKELRKHAFRKIYGLTLAHG